MVEDIKELLGHIIENQAIIDKLKKQLIIKFIRHLNEWIFIN